MLLGGTMAFLRIELVPIPALYGAFIAPLNLWLAAMGMFMWRRSRTVIEPGATVAAPHMARVQR